MTVRHSFPSHSLHTPVMLHQMFAALKPQDGGRFVDATFGAGGYTRAILEAANCTVYAIDRDPNVRVVADQLREEFNNRFVFISGAFSQMVSLLEMHGVSSVDGIVMDIGVSSMQIDEADRGFSFRKDGPLDMRMAQEGTSAADVVNSASEGMLAEILSHYGEEKAAKRIAKAIVAARAEKPITTTHQLSAIVSKILGRGGKIDPATRTFQALRIYVNDELGELTRALEAAEHLLAPGGRLVVVSFHSLEDRIVKRFLQSRTGSQESVSRHVPDVVMSSERPSFVVVTRKALEADEEESRKNPRARSAKLRSAIRTNAPAMRRPFPKEGGMHAAF